MTTRADGGPRPAISPGRLVAGPVLALVAGCAAGAAVGALAGVVAWSGASDSDDWAALGALLVGAVVGVAGVAVVYLTALVVAARRLFAPGRRLQPVLLTVLGSVAVVACGAWLLAVLRSTSVGWTALVLLLGLAAAACGPAGFLWSGGPARLRLVAAGVVLGPLLAAGGVVVVSHVVGQVGTGRVAAEMPLVLFDGTTADPLFPGWRRDRFGTVELRPAHSFTERGHEGYLKYFTPNGVTFVTMHTDAGDCAAPAPGFTCSAAGALPGGQLRWYVPADPDGYPRLERYLTLVYPDGSAVSVSVASWLFGTEPLGFAEARAVLEALERVDRDRFEEQAGAPLSLS